MKTINVTQSSLPPLEEYVKEISELWENKWLTNMGKKHEQLEIALKDYLNVDNITLFTNGHLALETLISALDLTGEIITTPFTFASTTHAIIRNNLTPVFCDIRKEDYTIDTEKIEDLITDKTTAIVPVHVYGNICKYEEISKIAEKYGLKVIYDAAHAFGEKINDINIANIGDASMFSFHATKVFHTIEGGAVTYRDEVLKSKLNRLKNFGIDDYDCISTVGGNGKMNEFQASMGLCNLRYIENEIEKRKKIFFTYTNRLNKVDGIKIQKLNPLVKSNYSYFPVLFETYRKDRNIVFEELKKQGILSRKYFYPLTNDCDAYGYHGEETPIAKYVAEHILCLPIYADLSPDIANQICDIILN